MQMSEETHVDAEPNVDLEIGRGEAPADVKSALEEEEA